MEICLLKTASLLENGECIEVFTITKPDLIFEKIVALPGYIILGKKELYDIPLIDSDQLLKNYEQLLYGQPEIRDDLFLQSAQGTRWYPWNKSVEDIFFDVKIPDIQIIEYGGIEWAKEKDIKLRGLIAYLSVRGGDNSGSLLNEFLMKTEEIGLGTTKKIILEEDWKAIYQNSELIRYLCPDINEYFQAIICQFGSINVVFEKSGEVTEYIPKSDRYNYKELKALRDSLVTKKQLREQLRDVCEFMMKSENEIYPRIDMPWLPEFIKEALNILEPEKLKALGYNKSDIIEEIKLIKSHSLIKDRLARKLKPGERYTREFLKNLIKNIFTELKLPNTSKPATYIQNFFNVEECRMWLRDEDGNRKKYWAYRIVSMKED